MTSKRPAPAGKVIRRRLLSLAKERHDDFNLIVIRYGLERLLYRLSRSTYRDDFILKGAMLFALWSSGNHRSTRDLDLLGQGVVDHERLRLIFAELCAIPCEDDGMNFLASSVQTSDIRADTQYRGLRVDLTCELDTITNVRLQVDVGFGDAVVPAPEEADFPTLLDLPRPRIRVYPRDVVVAEKTQAMVKLGFANSRMKDFYDIHFLAMHFSFSGTALCSALATTFARRETPIPSTMPTSLTAEFTTDALKVKQWQGFLRKSRFLDQRITLEDIAVKLRSFLGPPLQAVAHRTSFALTWLPGSSWGAELP